MSKYTSFIKAAKHLFLLKFKLGRNYLTGQALLPDEQGRGMVRHFKRCILLNYSQEQN